VQGIEITEDVMEKSSFSVVHVDDSPIILRHWKRILEKEGTDIFSTSNPLELFANLDKVNKNTLFFVDYELGNKDFNGEDILNKLHSLGFRKLYLSTGFPKAKFNNPKILEVFCKRPPNLAPLFFL
jgi:CheY-like chemotaxis protein